VRSPGKHRLALAAAMAAVAVLPGLATGQAQPAPALTLEQAFERARHHNPAYQRAVNNLDLNTYEVRQAWLNLLPTPRVDLLRTSTSWRRTTVAEDFFGRPLENPETRMVQTSNSTQGAGVSLFVDFRQFLQLRQTRTQVVTREVAADAQLHTLRSDLVAAFVDASERRLVVDLDEQLLETARLNEEAAKQLFILARRDRVDVLSAELAVADRESRLESSRAALRTSLLALRNLIGDPSLSDFTVEVAPVRVFDPALLQEELLVTRAVTSSPPVLQQEASLETQLRGRTIQQAVWLPTLSVQLGTGRQSFVRGGGAFMDVAPNSDWDRNVSVAINFPDLGQYLNRRNQVGQSEVGIRNQRETLRQLRGETEQQVRTLVVELQAQHRGITLQERRAAIAEERLELLREEYAIGRRDFFELQNAANEVAQAQQQALQARFGFERARVSLERALGMPLEDALPALRDADGR
jgi:outer membrane protein TolC